MVQILHSQRWLWKKNLYGKDCGNKRKCDLHDKEFKNKRNIDLHTGREIWNEIVWEFVFKKKDKNGEGAKI